MKPDVGPLPPGLESGAVPASRPLDTQHPWPGLRSFAEAESDFFFGRKRETQTLLEMIGRSPVTVLYGQSGLGKTSLLRAGLFAPLKAAGHVPVWVRLDHATNAPPLARQILNCLMGTLTDNAVEAEAPRDDDSLWSYFHRQDADFWDPRNRLVTPLIVLDQFEELFTLGQRDAEAATRSEQLLRELEAQFEQRPPAEVRLHLERYPEDAAQYELGREAVRFVISLREDYLPHLDAWRERLPSMLARRFRLEQMTGAQALEVVQRAGGELVDATAAEDIVAFVASNPVEGVDAASIRLADTRIEPAILSVVCDELNLRRLRAGLPCITRELLSGERGRIIGDFYERSFQGIAEPVRDWVEDELLTATGHRDRAAVEDARRADIDISQLFLLVDRRVLHSDERNHVLWVEFTHDLLTEPALASRNDRQRRVAQAQAAEREAEAKRRVDEVRAKLRRSRLLAGAFAFMTVVMMGGAWRLKAALDEAKRDRETASVAQMNAEAHAARAIASKGEADDANIAKTKAAKEALEAEIRARESLSKAEATALELADQGIDDLKALWLDPGYDSVTVARASLLKIETLIGRFSGLPMMHVHHQQALASAALLYCERGDERECTRLARSAVAVAGDVTERSDEATLAGAMSDLAMAYCLRMRGRYVEAGGHSARAYAAAQKLPLRWPSRQRLMVLGTLGQSEASAKRYDFHSAATVLSRAKGLIVPPREAVAPDATDATAWRLDALELEGQLAGSYDEALAFQSKAQTLLAGLPLATREAPIWRNRKLNNDLSMADTLFRLGRNAEAFELAESALAATTDLLTADPAHVRLRLRQNQLRRLHAEILFAWGRKQQALAMLKAIDRSSAEILASQPEWVQARYVVAISAWLQSLGADNDDPSQLKRAVHLFDQLARDVPQYGDARRSLAISLRMLHENYLRRADRKDIEPALAREDLDRAADALGRSMQALEAIRFAGDHRLIGDVAGEIETSAGHFAVRLEQPANALATYQRAIDRFRRIPVTGGNETQRAMAASMSELFLARHLRKSRHESEALAVDERLLADLDKARQRSPHRFDVINRMAWVHRMAASDYLLLGSVPDAVRSATRATQLLSQALRDDPLNNEADEELSNFHDWTKEWIVPRLDDKQAADVVSAGKDLVKLSDPSSYMRATTTKDDTVDAGVPGVPGDWEHIGAQRLRQPELKLAAEVDRWARDGWTAVRARRLELPFYGKAQLVELDLRGRAGEAAVATFVTDGTGVAFQLIGRIDEIGAYNATHDLNLASPVQARLYMRMYLAAVSGDNGTIRLIDHTKDLLWTPDVDAKVVARASQSIEPFELSATEGGAWSGRATMQWGGALYRARLTLTRGGQVKWVRGVNLANDLPLYTERYAKGLRVRMETEAALESVVARHRNDNNWKAAAQAQQLLLDFQHARLTDEAERRKTLSREYIRLSWYQLLAGEMGPALASADAGLTFDDSLLALHMNRAHALLLLDRNAEAQAIYEAYRGKRLTTGKERLWQDEVLNDLDLMEAAGVKDKRFAPLRAQMKASPP